MAVGPSQTATDGAGRCPRSADHAALERLAFGRLLGDGGVVRGLDMLLDREAAAARRHLQQGVETAAGS
eukprot:6495860-Prymnesium_polylepis.1